jgi:hypothetical protein
MTERAVLQPKARAILRAFALFLALCPMALAQGGPEVTLSGTIRDAQTNEPLDGANVYIEALRSGTVAGSVGTYRLSVPLGTHEVRFSYVGYEAVVQTVVLDRSRVVDVSLRPSAELEGVTVTAEPGAREAPVLGVTRMSVRDLERLPTLLGEVDVTRGLLLLPGVTSVGEGSGGFNVRGGNVDQNLMLLDGTQVFFASHLFGMFSAFNPDLVEDVTMYRGTIPARYGGRISSVVDVRQRDGRDDRFGVRGSVGLVSSRLALEGPLAGEALTALIGGRMSYANWMLRLAERPELRDSRAGYADLGGRLAFRPSARLQAQVSGYLGTDDFRFGADTTYRYDTRNAALQASYAVSRGTAATLQAALSTYYYGFTSENALLGFDFDAQVTHARVQPALVWSPGWGTVEAGAGADYYRLQPGLFTTVETSPRESLTLQPERAVEPSVFLSADVERGRWRFEAGLRYALWTTLGPAHLPVLDPALPRGPGSIVDTFQVGAGDVVARYGALDPRLAVRFSLSPNAALKAGYSRLHQNVHLLSNTTAPTPVDRWKLSDDRLRPQVGDQVTAGVHTRLPLGLEATVEGYYRWLHDVPTYRPGASLLLSEFVTAELLDGDGRAYGAELHLERSTGTVTGWLNYTLSRSERRAFAAVPADQINFGAYYPSDFDRPHDLALSLSYHESAWATWAVNFVYGSGRPLTLPTGMYDLGDLVVPSYTLRNQARVPAYHRLDFSLTVEAPAIPTGRYRGRWTFALYNVYARRNAYSVFFAQQPGTRIPQAYRLSTIGTILPSITYTFEF